MYDDNFEGWTRSRRGRPIFALALTSLIAVPVIVELTNPDIFPGGKGPVALTVGLVSSGGVGGTGGTSQTEQDSVAAIEEAIGSEISPELAESIRQIQAEELMDPASNMAMDTSETMDRLKQIYSSINPVDISIPSSIPDLAKIITVADALNPEITGDITESPVMRYALGEDGISSEMEAAFRTVKKAKEGELIGMSEQEVADLARERIGYVPTGVPPKEVQDPIAQRSALSRTAVEGIPAIISAHQFLINDTMIRLEGVRAPSHNEICKNADGAEYDCVSWSMEGMKHIMSDKSLSCAISSVEHEEGGLLGRCLVAMGETEVDLAKIAAQAGVLLTVDAPEGDPQSPYVADMDIAKTNKSGIWSGTIADRNVEEPAE